MRIVFFTPIEEAKPFVTALNINGAFGLATMPRIGDTVLLNVRENVSFNLDVNAVTWDPDAGQVSIRLYIPGSSPGFTHWIKWFKQQILES